MRNITITFIDKEEIVNEYFTDKLVTGAENVNDYFTDKLVTGAENVNAYFTDKLVTGTEHITIITYCYSCYRDRKCNYNLPSNHFLCERELQVTFK